MLTPSATLSVSGNTLLSTLNTSGSTVIGASSSQTVTVNAAASFTAAVTAAAPVSILAGNAFSALGDATVGTNPTNTLSVNAKTVFVASVTCNAAVSVTAGNAFSALGNIIMGSSSVSSMLVNAAATFASPVTFNQALQLFSSSSTAGSGVVLGYQRTNNGGAVPSGFTLGSILFSAYDGSVQGPTAQMRSVLTVSERILTVVHATQHSLNGFGHDSNESIACFMLRHTSRCVVQSVQSLSCFQTTKASVAKFALQGMLNRNGCVL